MPKTEQLRRGQCARCGASLLKDAADGLCVRCLLTGALTPPEEEIEAVAGLESPSTLLERREFAGYALLGEIARGGMGVVFRARQKRPERTVALKVIAAGELATPRMVERFRTEAEAAARLDHPNIVPIYEVGHHGGWHFFSMRLIEGCTLAEKLRGQPLPLEDAVRLMVKIARAVQHAHERGVLHRDLKPNNILLDTRGEPHLTDFGLAKMVESSVEMTMSNAILGTPAYMAPEQAAGGTRDVTVSVDVYGLGAVFYEMLTGRPPFEGPNTHALLRKVAEEDPIPPSRVASRGPLVNRKSEIINPTDLDAICLKCLEKEPALRYHTPEQFADDLERALRGEPISAQPSTATQRMRKWVRRNPAPAAVLIITAAALLLLTVISLAFNWKLSRARNIAVTSEAEARRQLVSHHLRESARRNAAGQSMLGMLPLVDALRMEEKDPATQRRINERLSLTMRFSPSLAALWDAGGTPVQLQFSADGRRLLGVLRSGEPRAWDLHTRQIVPHPDTGERTHRASLISPDGSQVVEYFNEQPYASIWNVPAGTLPNLELNTWGGNVAAFSPDGKMVASGGQQVRLWDALSGAPSHVSITNSTRCIWLTFSPDGQQLITGHDRDEAWRWNVRTGERLRETPLTISPLMLPRFSSDGAHWLVTATGRVQVLDWKAEAVVSSKPAGRALFDMTFSPDGKQFATAGFYDHVRFWTLETGEPFRTPITHESGANKVVFSPDGALIATAGFDYQLRIVRAADHRPVFPAIHHSALIEAVAFSPDSRFLAIGDVEGVVQVWDLQPGHQPFMTAGEAMRRIAHFDNGERMAMEDAAGALHFYDLVSGAEIGQTWTTPVRPAQISVDVGARFIAGAFRGNGVYIWDFATRKLLHHIDGTVHPAARDVRGVILKPDGSEFVTMTPDGVLQRWNTRDGKPVGATMRNEQPAYILYWSADGRWIASAGSTFASIWNARTSTLLGSPILPGARETISDARFSPDGERFVVSFANLSIEPAAARIYELPSLQVRAAPLRHGDGVSLAGFSADSQLVATAGEDNVARIWRVADGQPVTGTLRHNGIVTGVLFTRDGRLLATGSVDGSVRLWDVERGEMIAPLVQLGGPTRPICSTPDGNRIFVTVAGARETIWSIDIAPKSESLAQVQSLAECQTGFRADLSQGAVPLTAAELAAKFSALPVVAPPSSEQVLGWHSQNAIIAERQSAWFTAAFHLQRLLAAKPDDAAVKGRLENARARLGQ
jgi:serine/threonine protein kinase/WD40 repeat protein